MRQEHRETLRQVRQEWLVMCSTLIGAASTFAAIVGFFDDLGWQFAAALSVNVALMGIILALYRTVTREKRQHGEEIDALWAKIASIQREARWDEDALLVSYDKGRLPDSQAKLRKKPPTLKFWLYASNSLPQPNRLRLWFTVEPNSSMVTLYAEDRGFPVRVGHDRGTVKINGTCMEIEYTAPPLSTSQPSGKGGKVGQLLIFVRADEPIDIVRTAAYR